MNPQESIGHYRITGKLGEGGMGVVYKARDTRLDRVVAIKLLARDKVADASRKQRFFQEARAASALNHPNIITIYEIGSEGQTDYLVMEFVQGKTLEQLIPRKGLRVAETLQYALQFADALAAAHASGIIHRDIKPSNLMVTEEGRVKVLDFGLAKLAERTPLGEEEPTRTIVHTQEGLVFGSVPYMSPEQAEGKVVDERTDIFSLGAVLYEMCTGQRAFTGDSSASTLVSVMTKDPISMEEAAPDTPAELRRTIWRCLRKEPNRRFQSMLDLKLTLEELKSESESGRLTLPLPRAAGAGRKFRLTLLVVAAFCILGVPGGWLWQRYFHEQARRPLSLEQVTFDRGLTTDPAISPDGKLIAYASDRSGEGSLDIWVQYRGGEPVRITHSAADEDQPAFSPDGTQIAYRSAQDGGSIYIASSLGGGEPRLVTRSGGRPQFSPDGAEILVTTQSPSVVHAYIVNLVSPDAPRKQIAPDFGAVASPVWSPDGQSILFYGARIKGNQTESGLWVIPRNGGAAERVELDLGSAPSGIGQFALHRWLPGDRILAEFEIRGRTQLWQARLRRKPWRADRIEQITFGTGMARNPSVAADGTMVVSSEETDLDLWSLPFDAIKGTTTGDFQRLTQDAAREAYPSISVDGSKLAYSAEQASASHIWIMDLPSRSKRLLTSSPDVDRRPVISMDGRQIAYMSQHLQGALSPYRIAASGGTPQKIRETSLILWDWSNDGQALLALMPGRPAPFGVDWIEAATGKVTPFLRRPNNVFQAHISHDGHWAIAQEVGPGVLITPLDSSQPMNGQWRPLGLKGADLIRWSPDDNSIYFISLLSKTGQTCSKAR